MRIGQISKQTGLSIDAIRFYERSGMIKAPPRSEGGFRMYSSGDVAALRFIRSLQTLGFSLNEIREFLSLRANDLEACFKVRNMLCSKMKNIHAKRLALVKLEDELKAALAKCNARLRRSRLKSDRCPILAPSVKSKRKDAL